MRPKPLGGRSFLGAAENQDRTGDVAQRVGREAPQHELFDSGLTVRGDDDQVDSLGSLKLVEGVDGLADQGSHLDVDSLVNAFKETLGDA